MKLPVLVLGSLLLACDAWGCSIIVGVPLKVLFQGSEYVFVGTVRTIEHASATLDVTEQFRGEPVSEMTFPITAGCSFTDWKVGKPYLVMAEEDPYHGVSAEHPTHELVSADDRELRLVRRRARWWNSPLGQLSFYKFRHWVGTFMP